MTTHKQETAQQTSTLTESPIGELLQKPLAVIDLLKTAIAPRKSIWEIKAEKPSELIANPDNWMQNRWANKLLNTDSGIEVSPDACRVCVGGALCVIFGISISEVRCSEVGQRLNRAAEKRGFSSFVAFNDEPRTTHADAIELLKECDL